jgi:hypothetical protein
MDEFIVESVPAAMRVNAGKGGSGYRVSLMKYRTSMCVTLSGSGVWALLTAGFLLEGKNLDASLTYQKLKKQYGISGGVNGLWCWLVGVHNTSEDLRPLFYELQVSETSACKVNVSLYVTGLYPGVEVNVCVYVYILEVADKLGNKFHVFSPGDPLCDIGGQDQDGNVLPVRDNKSTIELQKPEVVPS